MTKYSIKIDVEYRWEVEAQDLDEAKNLFSQSLPDDWFFQDQCETWYAIDKDGEEQEVDL